MKKCKVLSMVLVFLMMFLVGLNVQAQDVQTKVTLESRYMPESDVDHQAGQIAIGETKFSFQRDFKLENGMPITFLLSDKHIDLNSDVDVELPASLEGRSLGLGAKFPAPFTQSDRYFVGIDVFPSMYTDGWEESSSSAFRIPFRPYLIYRRDENFIIIAGVTIRPDYNSTVLPVIGFIYKPNAQWSFNFASDNPNITYQLSEKTRLLWEADIVNDEYEVTRGEEEGRVLYYRQLSTGLGLEHAVTKNVSALVSIGGVFSRSIKYEDDQGKIEPEPGLYFKGRLTINF